ncbi:MAG: hypothetical protein K6C35_05610 [Eubacterium sp.]|nr:hypothetical protein [Eubacterium sp.]
MADSKALTRAVRCKRETLKTVSARGVDMKKYRNEILPYKIPAGLAQGSWPENTVQNGRENMI